MDAPRIRRTNSLPKADFYTLSLSAGTQRPIQLRDPPVTHTAHLTAEESDSRPGGPQCIGVIIHESTHPVCKA